jgi:uncharacterized repeat protein (TIGR03803 family)
MICGYRSSLRKEGFQMSRSAALPVLLLGSIVAGCSLHNATSPLPAQQPSTVTQPLTNSSYKVIYSFARDADGKSPNGLIAFKGSMYGTTFAGGAHNDNGEVFRITPAGQAHIIYSFMGGRSDGSGPVAAPIVSGDRLYGTTYTGGKSICYGSSYTGCGTVYAVTPSGSEKVLHNFSLQDGDGINPFSSLVATNGKLYGTTEFGGGNACSQIYESHSGCGIVFMISASGSERSLYALRGAPQDGAFVLASLTALNGKFYGTTLAGGGNPNCYQGCGVVFEVTSSGKERVLHRFTNGNDGGVPEGSLIAINGKLYGTTASGGRSGNGTVFEITPSGKERVLHSFKGGSDGMSPAAGLAELNGTFYGTTTYGGNAGCYASNTCGTIFSVTAGGTERVLYRFKGGTDGENPLTSLTALDGTFYGTTPMGGSANLGTVYRIAP